MLGPRAPTLASRQAQGFNRICGALGAHLPLQVFLHEKSKRASLPEHAW